ncbi:MAG: poly-beta-1,6 N-acetyl-D-glucosamine export porin PgaA [Gammaproteobacteria bacterium]|nr:poly-beta-1,6 N-acetyl-D-glucosamine export porin PgaA [Gammaproteobacteria bacterium]
MRTILTSIILLLISQPLYALRLYTQDQYQAARERAVEEARSGNHKSALLTLKRLLKLEPDNVSALNDYITILIWDEQYQKALNLFPTLNLQETPEYVLRYLAMAADKLKQKEVTQQLVKIYFDKYPVVPQDALEEARGKTQAEMVLFTNEMGMRQTSLAILTQLIDREPENQIYLADYINTLFYDKQYQKVLEQRSKLDINNAPEFVLDALIESAQALNQNEINDEILHVYHQRFNIVNDDSNEKLNLQEDLVIDDIIKVDQSINPDSFKLNKPIQEKQLVESSPSSEQQLILQKASQLLDNKKYIQAEKLLRPLYLNGKLKEHNNKEFIHLMIRYFDSQKNYQQTAYLYQILLSKTSPNRKIEYQKIERQLILNLFYAGAPFLALEALKISSMKNQSSLLTEEEYNKVIVDINAFYLRWSDYKQAEGTTNYEAIDKTIKSMEKERVQLKDSSDQYIRLRLNYDYITALRKRERMQDVINEFERIMKEEKVTQTNMPDYVLNAVADAYQALKQPKISRAMYLDLLTRQPENFLIKRSLSYAYFDTGEANKAIDLIKNISDKIPLWRKDHSGEITKDNNEKLQAKILLANTYAYADDLVKSQELLESMRSEAPYNVEIRDNLAQIYRWRGWPEKSFDELLTAKTIDPDYLYVDINTAYTFIDTYQFSKTEELLQSLNMNYAEHSSVKILTNDWARLNKRQFFSWFDMGESDSNNNLSQSNYGSSDMSIESYLYGAMLQNKYRPFIHQYFTESDFEEGTGRYERIGMGLEYRNKRSLMSAELSNSYTSESDAGFSLQGEHNLNDYFQLAFAYNSFSTKVPVRAYYHHIDGYDVNVSAQLRFNELTQINTSYEMLDFSDGNLRDSWSLSFSHRIINHPKYKMLLTPSYYQSKNSKPGGPYFAPKSDQSYGLSFKNEWLSYVESDTRFNQILELNIGKYDQHNYGNETTTAYIYQHEWTLSKELSISYGLKVSRNYYDGDKEKRESAFASLNWLF